MVRNRDRPRPSEQIARNRQQISSLLDDERYESLLMNLRHTIAF